MSVKQIVKEAMDRNPINMKEALSGELRTRVARAIEERAEQLSESSFKVGDKVKHPYDGSGPTPVVGTVKEVRGSGKDMVVSVDFGEGIIDLMPNSGDRMDKLVKESLDKKEVIRVYNKIKDFSKDALKGYAKKIGMPRDAISSGSDTEELVDEIMSFLFDEDWLSIVMKSGNINESTVMVGGEEWEVIEKNRASIVIKSKRDGAKLSLHKGEKMFNAVSKQLDESKESLEEAVRIGYDRYKRSHGSKPGTQSGLWMFTNKSSGTPDYNDDEEVFEYNGTRKEAEKAAKEWAKTNGYRSVYVME